jgi:hypothetical protein
MLGNALGSMLLASTLALAQGAPPAPPAAQAAPPARTGALQVAVDAPGAKIYVDGELKGTAAPNAPLELDNLPAGTVLVRATVPGRPYASTAAEILPGQLAQVRLTLAGAAAAPAPAPGSGYLGLAMQPLDETLQAALGIKQGALVCAPAPGSPAEAAGIRSLDVVTAVDGRPVNLPEDLVAAIAGGQPGASVSLALWRGGHALTVQAVLAARPAPPPPAPPSALEKAYGFTVAAGPFGVLVRSVAQGSPAAAKRLGPGLVILGVGTVDVADLDAFNREAARWAGKALVLRLRAVDGSLYIAAVPPRP